MKNWQKETVLYQIYPKSFCDSNGDGIGDIPGIISKVPYLKALGINAVWLSPCYPSPNDDNGYDISDYRDIAPEYGTLGDFKRLLDELHSNGIRLLLDLVVNHTSDEHEWFRQARKSRDNPYRDYYIWRDPVDGREPTDWKAAFGGSVWEYDEATGQYYFHLFSKKQPDLNWDNPKVREEIADMVNYWLDMGVDGFRCDVINNISKDLDNGILGMGPHLHEYLHELHEKALGPHGALTVGETWGLTPAQTLAMTGEARGELTTTFQFEHILLGRVGGDKFKECEVDRKAFVDILAKWEYGLKNDGYPVLVMENHDQPRAVSRFGDEKYPFESATMLAVLLYGMRGLAVIYEGQELGLMNPIFNKLSDYRDIETINAYREMENDCDKTTLLKMMNFGSRDNSRVPMPWNNGKNAGFSAGTPWIVADFDPDRTVEAEEKSERSVLKFYRKLLALRQSDKVLLHGDFELLQNDSGTVLYKRGKDGETRYIAVRFADTPAKLPDGIPENSDCLLCNYEDPGDTLRPYEARIYKS
ncbi:MAG: alpha-glucosidase [Clostridia bacterium]|nr:alpha-glucosidase [Clostridia bacterium]